MRILTKSAALFSALLIATLALPSGASAQRLVLYGVDTTAFPVISARLVSVDPQGRPLPLPDTDGLVLRERGHERPILELSGCRALPAEALSVSVVVNIRHHLDRTQAFLRQLIAALPTPDSEMSIVAGDREMIVLRNMTSNRGALLETVRALRPFARAWPPALVNDSVAGGYAMLRYARRKKMVVVLTETDPLVRPVNQISFPHPQPEAPMYLAYLGDNSNSAGNGPGSMVYEFPGWTRGDAADTTAAVDLANCFIAEQSGAPCRISWRSGPDCDEAPMPVEISVPSLGLTGSTTYRHSAFGVTRIATDAMPSFFNPAPGGQRTESVTLIAEGGPVEITSIMTSDPRFEIVRSSLPPLPLQLDSGARWVVRMRFTPTDSSTVVALLTVQAGTCTFTVPLTGGFHGRNIVRSPLRITFPNNGEVFFTREPVTLRWEGAPTSAGVRLEYSSDGGISWQLITTQGTGGAYTWKPPDIPGTRFLIRGILLESPEAGTDLLAVEGNVGSNGLSHDGMLVATWLNDAQHTIRIAEAASGMIRREFTVHPPDDFASNIEQSWHPHEHRLMTLFRRYGIESGVQIWDADSGILLREIRMPDSCNLYTAKWSSDGKRILTTCLTRGNAGRFILWNAFTGEQIADRGTERFAPVNWSPDGSYLLAVEDTASRPTLLLLDGYTGTLVRRFTFNMAVHDVVMRPDNTQIAVINHAINMVDVVDVELGTSLFHHSLGTRVGFSWSPDGSRIHVPYSYSQGGQGLVLDAASFTVLYTIPKAEKSSGWSPDGRFIASREGKDIVVYNAVTGRQHRTLAGIADNRCAAPVWSPAGHALSFYDCISIGGRSSVWFVGNEGALPTDTSDTPFSLVNVSVSVAAPIIDMGNARPWTGYADTLVHAAICNNSPLPLRVNRISVSSSNFYDFHVIDGNGPFTLMPGTCRNITFAFAPIGSGAPTGWVRMELPSGRVLEPFTLTGRGIISSRDVVANEVRFDATPMGTERDTVARLDLSNPNYREITILGVASAGPDSAAFQLLSPLPPFKLKPGEIMPVAVRFRPANSGLAVTRFLFASDDGGEPFRVRVSGEGNGPRIDTGTGGGHTAVEIFPNQAHDATTVYYTLGTDGPATLELYDLTGRRLAVLADGAGTAGPNSLPVSVRELATGMYIVRLRTAESTANARVQVFR